MLLFAGLASLLVLLSVDGNPDRSRNADIDRQINELEQFLKSPAHTQRNQNDIASAWSNLGEKYSPDHF